MRPLAEALAAAGYTVELPAAARPRHRVEDMVPTRWEDWSGGRRGPLPGAGRPVRPRGRRRPVDGRRPDLLAGRAPPRSRRHRRGQPAGPAPDAEFRAGDPGPARRRHRDVRRHRLGHHEGGRRRGRLRRARRWPPSCRSSRGPTTVEAKLGRHPLPDPLLSSREDHVVDAVSGDVVVERRRRARSSASGSSAATTSPPSTTTRRSSRRRSSSSSTSVLGGPGDRA